MATSTYPATGGFTGLTEAATFVPEIWSDEIVAAYKSNLVLANLVKKMNFTGKKGDTIHVPTPTRGTANAKVENTAVTIQGNTEGTTDIAIDKHFEYSRVIEDIVEVQALSSLRAFYTGDAGYALAKQTDTDLFALGKSLGDGNGTSWDNTGVWFMDDSASALAEYAVDTVTTSDVFVDAYFRDLIQKMDDADVPMDNRSFVVPPSLRNAIMGIDRYVSNDFVGGKTVNTGKIGEVYGIDVYVSTNCPIIETAADNAAGGDVKAAMLLHKDTFVLAEQKAIRSQTQYKQEWLGTLYTADTLYGVQAMRPDAGFALAVNG
jgi:N4-gp56 family major capsid protein